MKTQVWIAVSVYVLVATVRKRLGLDASLYQILQILSLTLLKKRPFYRRSKRRIPRKYHSILAIS